MRFTGSFHTIVTHGLAKKVISSGVVVSSTSGSAWTGLAVDTATSWHSVLRERLIRRHFDRAAHRPLRAHDAAGRFGRRHGRSPFGLRTLPETPSRGAALRGGGGRGACARRD